MRKSFGKSAKNSTSSSQRNDPTTEAIMVAATLSTQEKQTAPSKEKQAAPSTAGSSAAKATMTAALQRAARKVPYPVWRHTVSNICMPYVRLNQTPTYGPQLLSHVRSS